MPELKVHTSSCDSELMVQSEELRLAFVKRLKKALADEKIPEWGVGARLAEKTLKTAKAASKWLNGESMPSRANMIAIADWLNVRVEWLAHGEGEMRADAMHAVAPTDRIEEKAAGYLRTYQSDLYESAPADQRAAVDDIADKMLRLTPEQAMKLKQAMDLLMPTDDTRKD